MTIRTKAQLAVDYADNNTRAITAAVHRNAAESYMSCTGQLIDADGPLVIGTTAAPVSFAGAEAASGGITADAAFDYLDIDTGGDGIYLFGFQLTFTTNLPNNTLVEVGLYLNGVLGLSQEFPMTNQNSDIEIGSVFLTSQLVATNRVQLGIAADSAGTLDWSTGGGLMFLSRQASTPIS